MTERSDLIEAYLDELLGGLRGDPGEVRRMLSETETHLYADLAEGVERGLDPRTAARQALDRFGPAPLVARAWTANVPAEPVPMFLRRLAGQLLPLAGAGLVAVGLSGLVARLMTSVWGLTFMFAGPPGTRYPAAACRHWLAIHPHAGSCTNAYLAESLADGLQARYLAGLLGVVLLGAVAIVRHRRGLPLVARPPLLTSFTGAAVFAAAAVALAALAGKALRLSDGHGAGQWLSGAVVALPVAIGYAVAFLRSGRRVRLPA